MKRLIFLISLVSFASTLCYAQNTNQAAVDTLTKEVAKAVFANINQPKAQDIYDQLLTCGDGCDPQTIIRTVGGWDAVGVKMQELSVLKDTAPFIAMSPGDANTAIRKQLVQFYSRYKADNNYGKPLSPAVQAQIITKIDGVLPPAPADEPESAEAADQLDKQATADESGITPSALQLSKLERQAKEAEKNQIWMLLLGGVIGLLIGAGAVYFLFYRSAQMEVQRLEAENVQLSRALDAARRPKPVNEPRQPQGDSRQKLADYDAIKAELGTDNPLTAIRRLKQQTIAASSKPVEVVPETRPVSPPIELTKMPEPVQTQTPIGSLPPLEPLPSLNRSEVFYFPPPDPNGQFDSTLKSTTLSPESAYRFSTNADNSAIASFRFEADPGRLARFLTYRNYMIEPACESENSYMASHTRVAMRRDGQATLDNGVWRVKTKALIRYE